jgi:N-acetylmuramoyl-L-alanine amidase
VVLTRTTDVNVGIKDRARVAANNHAKLFLCLHFNGQNDASIRGTETFFRVAARNLNLQEDMAFANDVHAALLGALKAMDPGAKDRTVKPDTESGPGGLGVLNDNSLGNDQIGSTAKMCRSAYIEAEFISNVAADKLLISGPNAIANRTRAMAAVAKAMLTHIRGMP